MEEVGGSEAGDDVPNEEGTFGNPSHIFCHSHAYSLLKVNRVRPRMDILTQSWIGTVIDDEDGYVTNSGPIEDPDRFNPSGPFGPFGEIGVSFGFDAAL